MIHLALRSEYSFKKVYGFIDKLSSYSGGVSVGLADDNNTFGHVAHHRSCAKANVKPILGVRLMVCDKFIKRRKHLVQNISFSPKIKLDLAKSTA